MYEELNLENWPAPLTALSFPAVGWQMELDEAADLRLYNGEWGQCYEFMPKYTPEHYVKRLERAVAAAGMSGPFFPRLGSRSPKDAWSFQKYRGRCESPEAAFRMLMDSSERVHDDLSHAHHGKYRPSIYLRQWVEMRPENEFRCFVRDRQVIAISQYEYGKFGPEALPWFSHAKNVGDGLAAFISRKIVPHMNGWIEDGVFDLYAEQGPDKLWRDMTIRLIDVNPLTRDTDPCAFTWLELEEGPPNCIAYKYGPDRFQRLRETITT